MSSNGDPAVNMVVADDAVVVVASDNNDGDMQAAVHSVAKSKRKRQKTPFSMGVCQRLAGWRLCQALQKVPVHGVSQVVLRIDQCIQLESPHDERTWHHR